MSGSNTSALTPDLYPEVVKSTTFLIDILQENVNLPKEGLTVSVSEYLQETYQTIYFRMAWLCIESAKNQRAKKRMIPHKNEGEPLNLSQADLDLINGLASTIEVTMIKSEGGNYRWRTVKIIKVSVEQQDPYVSAVLTEKVIASLKEYIIDYHTSKEKKRPCFYRGPIPGGKSPVF